MADHWVTTAGNYSFRFFSPDEIDRILREALKRGRTGSHDAIQRILKHEPGLERAELWQRIRQIKYPSKTKRTSCAAWTADEDELLRKGYANGWEGKKEVVRELLRRHPDWRPHVVWKRAGHLALIKKTLKRRQERSQQPWSEHDDRILLNLAGYKEVRVISKILHRSPNAVRCRLSRFGKSTRVHKEGYAQRALSEELHFGSRTIRKLIALGVLEVRDPRITKQSLKDVTTLAPAPVDNDQHEPNPVTQISPAGGSCAECPEALTSNPEMIKLRLAGSSRADRVWSDTATRLGWSLQTIKDYVAQGRLKLYDPRITESSLRNLCRRYGSLVNYDYLNGETRAWLESSLDFARKGGEVLARQLDTRRKHAQVIRNCACGRKIRGNAFFRHARRCDRSVRSNRSDSASN